MRRQELIEANRARARARRSSTSTSDDAAELAAENAGTTTPEDAGNAGPEEPLRLVYPQRMMESATDYLSIAIFDYAKDTSKETSKNPINLTARADEIEKILSDSNNESYVEKAKKLQKNSQYVILPIPQSVSDSVAVDYASDTINPLQVAGLSATQKFMKDGKIDLGEIKTQVTEILSKDGQNILTDQNINLLATALAGKAINQLGANVSISSLISRSQGLILQSNLELLFSGVQLRSFPFIFDFAPRDADEAETVRKIIRTIKASMSPRRGQYPGLFIQSPKLFKFAYNHRGREHPFLNKMKTGFLTSMNVDYTASGTYATYDDGTPVHMRMTLQFTEMNPIYAEDYGSPAAGLGVGY